MSRARSRSRIDRHEPRVEKQQRQRAAAARNGVRCGGAADDRVAAAVDNADGEVAACLANPRDLVRDFLKVVRADPGEVGHESEHRVALRMIRVPIGNPGHDLVRRVADADVEHREPPPGEDVGANALGESLPYRNVRDDNDRKRERRASITESRTAAERSGQKIGSHPDSSSHRSRRTSRRTDTWRRHRPRDR